MELHRKRTHSVFNLCTIVAGFKISNNISPFFWIKASCLTESLFTVRTVCVLHEFSNFEIPQHIFGIF